MIGGTKICRTGLDCRITPAQSFPTSMKRKKERFHGSHPSRTHHLQPLCGSKSRPYGFSPFPFTRWETYTLPVLTPHIVPNPPPLDQESRKPKPHVRHIKKHPRSRCGRQPRHQGVSSSFVAAARTADVPSCIQRCSVRPPGARFSSSFAGQSVARSRLGNGERGIEDGKKSAMFITPVS